MDLNYYLQREQVERVRADLARSGEAADAHRGLAELYRQRIDQYRSTAGIQAVPSGTVAL